LAIQVEVPLKGPARVLGVAGLGVAGLGDRRPLEIDPREEVFDPDGVAEPLAELAVDLVDGVHDRAKLVIAGREPLGAPVVPGPDRRRCRRPGETRGPLRSIAAFRPSCCFEWLNRSGRLEDVLIDDPFDPNGQGVVKLTEEEWQSVNLDSARRRTARGRQDFSPN
jgi:hypothetical protein